MCKPSSERADSGKVRYVSGSAQSLFGICWFQTPGDVGCIERLNQLVDEKVVEFVNESKRTGEPLPVEVAAVLGGGKVYQNRNMWIPIFFALVSISIIAFHCTSHPISLLVAAIITFLWYDMLSGVLHKSLDNPEFIDLPVLREPCLEFQWHHHIPQGTTLSAYAYTYTLWLDSKHVSPLSHLSPLIPPSLQHIM